MFNVFQVKKKKKDHEKEQKQHERFFSGSRKVISPRVQPSEFRHQSAGMPSNPVRHLQLSLDSPGAAKNLDLHTSTQPLGDQGVEYCFESLPAKAKMNYPIDFLFSNDEADIEQSVRKQNIYHSTLVSFYEKLKKRHESWPKKSFIPSTPISYTRRKVEESTNSHDDLLDRTSTSLSSSRKNTSRIHFKPSEVTYDQLQSFHNQQVDSLSAMNSERKKKEFPVQFFRPSSATIYTRRPLSGSSCRTARTCISTNSTAKYQQRRKSFQTYDYSTQQQCTESIPHEDTETMPEKYPPKEQVVERVLSLTLDSYKKNVQQSETIFKKPFIRHFKADFFNWLDPRVTEKNKQIEDASYIQAVHERLEKENLHFLKSALNRNEIRKKFRIQQQRNLIKRVLSNEPRLMCQINEAIDENIQMNQKTQGNSLESRLDYILSSSPSTPRKNTTANHGRRIAIKKKTDEEDLECNVHKNFGCNPGDLNELEQFEMRLRGVYDSTTT